MVLSTPTADALIEATIRSIHRHGLGGTTVTTVTELAGFSRGMVRHVFSSKQDMLIQTMDKLRAEWTAATEPDPQAPGADQVRSILSAMFSPTVFLDDRVDAWLSLSAAATADPQLRVIREQAYERWTRQLIAALAAAGVERPEDAAAGLLALADGLWLRHSLEPDAMPRHRAEAVALAAVRTTVDQGGNT